MIKNSTEELKDVTEEFDDYFGRGYISNYYKFLYEKAEIFLKEKGLYEKIIFNQVIFDGMFTDIMVDLKRLAAYHNITKLNLIKLCSYAASWWLRRKPFQLENKVEMADYIYINENFARTLLFVPIMDSSIFESDSPEFKELNTHLHHHLKYRNVNPQTLELFVESLVRRPNLYK